MPLARPTGAGGARGAVGGARLSDSLSRWAAIGLDWHQRPWMGCAYSHSQLGSKPRPDLERPPMTVRRRLLLLSISLLPAALVVSTGCSTTPPAAEGYVETPVGTVLTYSRRLTGSFGSGDTKAVWTYAEGSWQGRRMLQAMNSLGGGTLHDPKTFGIVANLRAAEQPTMSYDPPIAIEWPIAVGKAWTTKHTVTLHPSNQQLPYETSWKVEAYETVQVPAGSFAAYRVVRTGSDGEVETRWISTQRGVPLVKRTLVRGATHRQGAGTQEAELLEYKVPAR